MHHCSCQCTSKTNHAGRQQEQPAQRARDVRPSPLLSPRHRRWQRHLAVPPRRCKRNALHARSVSATFCICVCVCVCVSVCVSVCVGYSFVCPQYCCATANHNHKPALVMHCFRAPPPLFYLFACDLCWPSAAALSAVFEGIRTHLVPGMGEESIRQWSSGVVFLCTGEHQAVG